MAVDDRFLFRHRGQGEVGVSGMWMSGIILTLETLWGPSLLRLFAGRSAHILHKSDKRENNAFADEVVPQTGHATCTSSAGVAIAFSYKAPEACTYQVNQLAWMRQLHNRQFKTRWSYYQ